MRRLIFTSLLAASIGLFMASCRDAGISTAVSTPKAEQDSVAMLNEELEVPDSVTLGFCYYERSKLRVFLSDFIKRNPDCFNNEIAMESYSEQLKEQLDKAIAEDSTFIMDLAVAYDQIITRDATDKTTGKKAYVVGCKGGSLGEGYDSNDKYGYKVEYTIVGGVSKEEMIKLKEYTDYKITGTISARKDDGYQGDKFGITDKYGKTINLGCFFIKDLKLVEQ